MKDVNPIGVTAPARQSLSARVREALLERILSGQFQPGERLVEMRLAEEMGTSQAPVREALRELETLGIVISGKNRGTHVRAPDARELAEIYDVRAELESFAAGQAVKALRGQVRILEDFIDQMLACARRADVHGFAEANAKFHRTIVAAAGNRTLLEIWTRLDVKSRTTVNVIRAGRDLGDNARSHYPIIKAIASGKASAARQALRSHVLAFKPKIIGPARRARAPSQRDDGG